MSKIFSTCNSTENSDYAFIYLSYSHSTHSIEIAGTWVVTEYQPNLFVVILLTLALKIAIVTVKQRKKDSGNENEIPNVTEHFCGQNASIKHLAFLIFCCSVFETIVKSYMLKISNNYL